MDDFTNLDGLVADNPVLGVAEEAFAELSGRSSKKWAVILIAFVLGATVAVVLLRRRQRAAVTEPADDVVGG